ncbi:MAG: efflux RND transporter periplasmic adaptor subunit [Myxococcales bacterium]|nr:efflux RND transporter periplasmic adaptor subunit [Myxococcales bacterium]
MRRLITLTLVGFVLYGCGPSGADSEHTSLTAGDAGGGHEEDEEGHVELTPDQLESAGIRTVAAGPGQIQTTLELSASVAASLDAQAHVNPRVGGLVRTIHAQLGQFVKAGDPLCEIDSVDLGRALSAFLGAKATVETSTDILERERELLTRNKDLASEIFERQRDLAEREITTLSARYEAERDFQDAQLRLDSRVLELEARLARERIELVAAERELKILGLEPEALNEIAGKADEPNAPFGTYVIRAPLDGVIVSRDATKNEFVDLETTLFEIQDLSRVWVLGRVYEQDLASVRVGAAASVYLNAFPGVEVRGEVGFIDYRIETTTRAASVRIELDNVAIETWPEQLPIRPGMFASVKITTGVVDAAIVVPESAIVHESAGDFVFVEHEPGIFEQRAVRVGASEHDNVEIIDGLEPGESVAISGTFALKSAVRVGELGEGHSH